MKRTFDIGDIISVTTGIVFSPRGMDGIADILAHVCGVDGGGSAVAGLGNALQLLAATAKPKLVEQFPWAAEEPPPGRDALDWFGTMYARFGRDHEVDDGKGI